MRASVQRIHAALSPPGEAMPGWQAVALLAEKLGHAPGYPSAYDVFAEARLKYPFMKDAVWGPRLLPVQLRFGDSRG